MKTLSLLLVAVFALASTAVFAQDQNLHDRMTKFMMAGTVLKNEAEFKLAAKADSASSYFEAMVPQSGIRIGKSFFVELENRVDDFLDTIITNAWLCMDSRPIPRLIQIL